MIVLSLFDYTGLMVMPWAEVGYDCICVDIKHPKAGRFTEYGKGTISYLHMDLKWNSPDWETLHELEDLKIIFGFPVCTDLAVSGALHWQSKFDRNPSFQHVAARTPIMIGDLADKKSTPYMIENPLGRLSQLWRPYNHTFQPCEYGKYLPSDDQHPLYPNLIPPRDAYEKLTCLWTGNGFVMPRKQPVSPEYGITISQERGKKRRSPIQIRTGGGEERTKAVRSATPRGFALAVFYANC